MEEREARSLKLTVEGDVNREACSLEDGTLWRGRRADNCGVASACKVRGDECEVGGFACGWATGMWHRATAAHRNLGGRQPKSAPNSVLQISSSPRTLTKLQQLPCRGSGTSGTATTNKKCAVALLTVQLPFPYGETDGFTRGRLMKIDISLPSPSNPCRIIAFPTLSSILHPLFLLSLWSWSFFATRDEQSKLNYTEWGMHGSKPNSGHELN
jgi:hypothetical protein